MNSALAAVEITRLRAEAVALAGRTGDLVQRASVYHHLYADSGGNHSFPLLAAHGALWASGYFRSGMRFGSLVARGRQLLGHDAEELMHRLSASAEAFRDINRRVCVETFFIYQLTADPRLRDEAKRLVPLHLLAAMDRCHHARTTGRTMSDVERRELFEAFFLWEQAHIVGPAINQAFATFDWPLIRHLALRPKIRFAYFGSSPLSFRDFSDTAERIEKGMEAFDRASMRGWHRVEDSLDDYGLMPSTFTADPRSFFASVRRAVHAGPAMQIAA
jgi:hypothetical protein